MRYTLPLITFLIFSPQNANAICGEFIYEDTSGAFEYTYDCENKYSEIGYKLIRSYTNTLDFEFFKLVVDGSTIICTKLSNENEELMSNPCRVIGFPVKSFSESMNDTKINFEQYELIDFLKNDLNDLSTDKDMEFIYPENMGDFDTDKCVSSFKPGEINFLMLNGSYSTFSECVFQLEQYFTNR